MQSYAAPIFQISISLALIMDMLCGCEIAFVICLYVFESIYILTFSPLISTKNSVSFSNQKFQFLAYRRNNKSLRNRFIIETQLSMKFICFRISFSPFTKTENASKWKLPILLYIIQQVP